MGDPSRAWVALKLKVVNKVVAFAHARQSADVPLILARVSASAIIEDNLLTQLVASVGTLSWWRPGNAL